MSDWIDRHLERFVISVLGAAVSAEAVNTYAHRRLGIDPNPTTGIIEWGILAWCLAAPIGVVWWRLHGRTLHADRNMRSLVISLIVCGYLGIYFALKIPR